MNKKSTRIFLFLSLLISSSTLNAQSCDPWIQQAYKQLYQRAATAEECNIKNYNNGSWNNYNELVEYIKTYNARKKSPANSGCDPWIQQAYRQLYNREATAAECNIRNYNNGSWGNYDELLKYIKDYNSRKSVTLPTTMPTLSGDPWIFRAYKELYKREPNAFELNVQNYNNGSWRNYNELRKYIRDFQSALARQNAEFKTAPFTDGNVVVGLFIDGKQVAVDVISPNGGLVVAAGGANAVAAGGANAIPTGGINVIAPGGGNVIVNNSMAGVTFGNRYVTQSAGTRVLTTSGKGALIIR
jgi:hypothetical protein